MGELLVLLFVGKLKQRSELLEASWKLLWTHLGSMNKNLLSSQFCGITINCVWACLLLGPDWSPTNIPLIPVIKTRHFDLWSLSHEFLVIQVIHIWSKWWNFLSPGCWFEQMRCSDKKCVDSLSFLRKPCMEMQRIFLWSGPHGDRWS